MVDSFFDTSVLLYVVGADVAKAERTEALLRDGGALSVQVLNEAANVARRKMLLDWGETHALLSIFRNLLRVTDITADIHDAGLAVAERYKLSIYDAMIVASALNAGCSTLWSEDMHHGLVVEDRLRILNPFKA